jgi:hypothetical protein
VPSWHGDLSKENVKRRKNIFSKKEKSMKKKFIILLAIITIISVSLFTACGDEEEQPKNQSTIISLFDGSHSATIKGNLTDTEWAGVPDKIKTAINNFYDSSQDGTKESLKTIFNRGITIIVEKTSNYNNWKTVDEGKTLYININILNNLQQKLNDIFTSLWNNGENSE